MTSDNYISRGICEDRVSSVLIRPGQGNVKEEGGTIGTELHDIGVTGTRPSGTVGIAKLVDPQSELVRVAKATGICFGDETAVSAAG